MIAHMLQAFWSGIMGHHLIFVYGFALAFVWDWSKELKRLFTVGFSLFVLSTVSIFFTSIIYFLLFRPYAFSWLGFSSFNFGFFGYMVYLAVIFFVADYGVVYSRKKLERFSFLTPYFNELEVGIAIPMIRYIVFGIALLSDYFTFYPHQSIAFAMGSSLGFWIALYAVWAVRYTFRYRLQAPALSEFAFVMGVIGIIGLLFSLY